MNTSLLSSLQLFNLISPALPIGNFAYSQGIEYAIDEQWLKTEEDIYKWIQSVLVHSISHWDLPCIAQMKTAIENNDAHLLKEINFTLLASRETKELWTEDQQVGKALLLLLKNQDIQYDADFLNKPTVALGFALASSHYKMDTHSILMGYCWAWCENQVAASGKIKPLGQTQMQRILQKLMPDIEQAIQIANGLNFETMGNSLPIFALSSSLHQHQYSRLFRS
ncbi:urease accessory protein UreF [Marinicellulosiphila megalodicopiae]|uniref:urease accessory protein UreF n=1 Tax=Marinicellulosiphila megalodicopiae TaxID=2724896 RepID=UPI003BB129C4